MKTKDNGTEHLALYVDLDNFVGFSLGLGLPLDLAREIEKLTEIGKILIRRSFGDIYKLPLSPGQKNDLRKMLQQNQIQHEDIPFMTPFKNSADIRLAVEALSAAFSNQYIDGFAVVASDRDYLPLFAKLHELGKNIIGIGGNRDNTPELYVKSCDLFLYHEALCNVSRPIAAPVDSPEQHADLMDSHFNKDDALKQLVDAMKALEDKGQSIMPEASVIQMMRRLKPDFDFSTYGFSNFKELCEYAATQNVISINHQGVTFNLQLKGTQSGADHTATAVSNPANEPDVEQLHKWFESKVRIHMPGIEQRKAIYQPLFNKDIFQDGIPLTDLTKKVEAEVAGAKETKMAVYKVFYSLYKAAAFSCTPGETAYNPIVRGINIAASDYSAFDVKFIRNTIKVYLNEGQAPASATTWSQLFFDKQDMEDIIQEIIRTI